MKISQVMTHLEENPKLKFTDLKQEVEIYVDESGFLMAKYRGQFPGFDGNIEFHNDWQIVREPVDFMTALNNGRNIKPAEGDFEYTSSQAWLRILGNGCYLAGKPWVDYVNSKWYVE